MRRKNPPYQVGNYWLDQKPQRPSWYICWYEPGTRRVRRRSTGTGCLEEASRRLDDFYFDLKKPDNAAPTEADVRKIIKLYWEGRGQKIASSDQIRSSLNHFIDFVGHYEAQGRTDIPASAAFFDFPAQEQFIEWMMARPIEHKNKDGKVTVSRERVMNSVARNLGDIAACLNYAVKHGAITHAPYVHPIKAADRQPPIPARIPLDDMARMLNYALADKRKQHLARYILTAICTMARPEAILDIATHNNREQWDSEHKLLNLNPKGRKQTKKYRPIVPVIEPLATLLDAIEQDWLIKWNGGQVTSIKRAWRTMRDDLQLPKNWVAKNIRHTMASEMRKRRVDPWELQGWLGHRSLKSSEVYAIYDPTYFGTIREALEGYLLDLQPKLKHDLLSHCFPKEQKIVSLSKTRKAASS